MVFTSTPFVFVIGGLIICGVIRCIAKGVSTEDATVYFIYRTSALQLTLSIFGILSSFAFLSSVLNLAGSAVIISTMRNFNSARDIAIGRSSACSQAYHGANLAIAATVFSTLFLVGIISDVFYIGYGYYYLVDADSYFNVGVDLEPYL